MTWDMSVCKIMSLDWQQRSKLFWISDLRSFYLFLTLERRETGFFRCMMDWLQPPSLNSDIENVVLLLFIVFTLKGKTRPSMKRGWGSSTSHRCKERWGQVWAALVSAGGLPLNNMAQLCASAPLSPPKQWNSPHNHQQTSSPPLWWHCCDKTTHRWFLPALCGKPRYKSNNANND